MDILDIGAAASKGAKIAKEYTDTAIGELAEGLTYKGSVATVEDLPASGNVAGDCYNVTDGSGMYAWNGTSWGSASKEGPQGEVGTAAGFGTPTASAESVAYGQPASATVTASGPDTAKVFSFEFEIPKGQDGAHSVSVSATGTSTTDVKYIDIDGVESRIGLDSSERTALDSAIDTSGMGWTGSDSTVHKVNSSYLNTINNVTSTSTTDPLSANMGKELQDQISNLKNIGRFLAIWNCATGLPLTNPTTLPYTYKTGDYYRVGTVASGSASNYKPNGATYTGAASSTVETEDVEIGWVYYYDGTTWLAQSAGGGGLVQDVQINGTTILDSGSGVANIPEGGTSTYGVYKLRNTNYGIQNEAGIGLSVVPASTQMLIDKSAYRCPVNGSNLDIAVREGLGNNSLTWSDAYKAAARNTIGAISLELYDSTATPVAGVLYYSIED